MYPAARQYLSTVRDLVRFAVSRFSEAGLFFGHGNQNAWDEAVYLTLFALKLPLDRLEPFLDARLLPAEIDAVLKLVEARVDTRKPAAYLTHEAWLGGYRFYVDERVIVPRSFIYELLDNDSLLPWIEYPELVHSALDLCTGSGCLAILLAEAFPDAEVDAIDLSPEALAVAERNVADYRLQQRIRLLQGDLFAPCDRQYDLIVSNPPYVDAESVAALPDEYRHEPELALGSGEDGLDATRLIIEQAGPLLTDYGVLVVEIGHNRELLEVSYPELEFTWLDTSGGDGFVFLLTRQQLCDAGFCD